MSVPEMESAQAADSTQAEDSAQAGDGAAAVPAAPPKADPWSDPRLPWYGKPQAVDILCWAAIEETIAGSG